MIQIKLDPFKTAEQNVFDHMPEGESILYEFQVVPLDYRVKDRGTPTFFVTSKSLYFVYDDLMELFQLSELEMDILGEAPKFSPWQLWFEGKYYYAENMGESFTSLNNSLYYSRFAMNEKGQIPKEFAIREGAMVARAYQSWAMAQTLINLKNGIAHDDRISELFKGSFAKYNKTTVVTFFLVFLLYAIIKGLAGSILGVFSLILDVLFGLASAFMLWWIYSSFDKNLKRFKSVYDGYAVEYSHASDGSTVESMDVGNGHQVENATETGVNQFSATGSQEVMPPEPPANSTF